MLWGARLSLRCGATGALTAELATWGGATPLHYAAGRGDTAVCRVLLGAKADLSLRNDVGMTPLEHARWKLSGRQWGAEAPADLEQLLQVRR